MNLAVEGMAEMVEIEEIILLDICKKYGAEDLGSEYGKDGTKTASRFSIRDTL